MGKIISFINQKGGVGKTTTSTSIAAAMANKKKKTLVVDLDSQCNLSSCLGISHQKSNSYTVLKQEQKLTPYPINKYLEVLPGSIDLSAFELEMASEPGKEYLVKETVAPIIDKYDYILLDCSPNLGLISVNALTASDYYIIPILPHHLSMQGLTKLLDITDKVKKRLNPDLDLGGIILTQFNQHKILHKNIADVIKKHFGDKLFKSTIRENISLAEAPSTGKDIFRYAPKSNGAIDYEHLTSELIKKLP